jgi:hypothetical protein
MGLERNRLWWNQVKPHLKIQVFKPWQKLAPRERWTAVNTQLYDDWRSGEIESLYL